MGSIAGWSTDEDVLIRDQNFDGFLLQFTKNIPTQTNGRPTIKETVNSSLRKRRPKRTPKTGVKKVKAESLLTG